MGKNILILLVFIGVFLWWNKDLKAQFGALSIEPSSTPVVVELFTSQSCSSCPPADKLLHRIAEHDNIIALSCHVTYWNHLHWKDTLSQQFCTDRQRSYAAHSNSRRVYTPQMIVNGTSEFVGSRSSQATKEITEAAKRKAVDTIMMSIRNQNTIEINLPDASESKLWLMGYKKGHTQKVPLGENRGHTIHYVNSVIELHPLGLWNGKALTRNVEIKHNPDIDGYAIIAQPGGYGPIIAAGKIDF